MSDRPVVVAATANAGKLAEITEILEGVVELRPRPPDVPDVVEDAPDLVGNARLKARAIAAATGLAALADDTGLEVAALDGAPGVRSARFAGEDATDDDNNGKLLEALADLPPERRGARYVCALALALPGEVGPRGGGVPITFARGTCRGRIATAPRGSGGFGYDPIFEPSSEPPGGRTLGLWTPAEKNRISHRARAARRMAPRLAALGF
jgi:XTP/dITP diphosphohydrolase